MAREEADNAPKQNAGKGNEVAGLTPPSVKPAVKPAPISKVPEPTLVGPNQPDSPSPSGVEKTQIPSVQTPQSNRSGSLAAGGEDRYSALPSDIALQDLSAERLLRDAPRIDFNGWQCPSLNKIPLLAKIGQGGMGAVYYGVHPRLHSEVAVKVLPFQLAEEDPGMIRRFFREAQIAAQVHSPHLVNVLDVNEEAGLHFLVMEYVPGKTAGQVLKELMLKGERGLAELDAIDLCLAACEGLYAAHAQGIIHRDLKPENIMVPYLNRAEKKPDLRGAKLMDLGLARSEGPGGQSLTGVQTTMGTPGYIAPEQAMDAKTADKRSDIFGMGATLYALLTGRPPFKSEAVMKTLMAAMHDPHEPVSVIRPDISGVLGEIIDKCLAKSQEKRFQDVPQLIRALKNCRRMLAKDPALGDSGQMDAVPSSVLEDTLAGTVLKPGGTTGKKLPAVSAAPPRRKVLWLAAAAVLLVVIVGGVLALRGRPAGPQEKTVEKPIEKPQEGATTTNKCPYNPTQMANLRKDHDGKIKTALAALNDGDLETAKSNLDLAQLNAASPYDEALVKKEKEVQTLIELQVKKEEFKSVLNQIDAAIKAEDLPQAAVIQARAWTAALDEESKKAVKAKGELLEFLKRAEVKRGAFISALKPVANLPDDKIDEAAMSKLAAASSQVPDEAAVKILQAHAPYLIPDQGKLAELRTRFDGVLKRRDNEQHYRQLLNRAEGAIEAKDQVEFLEQAQKLLPDLPQAGIELAKARAKLTEADRQNLDEQHKKQAKDTFNTALREAGKLADNEPEKALVEVGKALALFPDDNVAKQLESKLRNDSEKKKRDAQFAALLGVAGGILDNCRDLAQDAERLKQIEDRVSEVEANLIQVSDKLAAAGKLYSNRPEIAELDKKLGEVREKLKRRKDYVATAKHAQEAARAENLKEAEKFYEEARVLDGKTPELGGVRFFIETETKKAAERQDKQVRFDNLMAEAGKLEAFGDKRANDENEGRVKDFSAAVDKYADAVAIAPTKESAEAATQKSEALKKKLDAFLAKVKEARQEAKKQARLKKVRDDYGMKIASANQQDNPKEKLALFESARAFLQSAQNEFKTELNTEFSDLAKKIEETKKAMKETPPPKETPKPNRGSAGENIPD